MLGFGVDSGIWRTYLTSLVYIIVLNLALLLATICLHEYGHLFLGSISGCSEGTIILTDLSLSQPCTEMECPAGVTEGTLALGAFLFTIPFALSFFLLKTFEKNFYLVIMGIVLTGASLDLIYVFQTEAVYTVSMMAGIILTFIGEYLVIRDLTNMLTGMQGSNLN